MKIIQITDLHIDDTTEDTRGVNVRSNFERMLDKIQTKTFDHLVVSGDLCLYEGKKSTYQWIKNKLDALQVEYSIISGNHDDNQLIKEVFNQYSIGKSKIYYSLQLSKDHIFFLDTHDGVLDQAQIEWMRQIYDRNAVRIIIFMHHPPVICGVPFMDQNHGMKNLSETQEFLHSLQVPVYIFCGHFHVDKYIQYQNMHVFVTPSNYFQMGQNLESFEVDHYNIGYREIEWGENDVLTTNTEYIYL